MVLPLQNFSLLVSFQGITGLGDLIGECEIVRMADSSDTDEPELGVRFINANHRDRRRIREYVEAEMQREREARAARAEAVERASAQAD